VAIVVQKYGGSSVATTEKIGEVADKIVAAKRRGDDVVVVVSAMGKTTDQLIALAKAVAKEPPRRELDMLVSTGERVSMALLSIAIQERGVNAISFTGSQSGIITSDRHFDARIIEVRPHRVEDELARGCVVIVAGYQGMSYKREITTLGRGGSDTTAVAMAAALGAERCEIYSDVDGVYTADPRVVPDAQHLPELDLAGLQEMAEAGAKVLNAQAVEWARKAKITIAARRTQDPVDAQGNPERQTLAYEGARVRARGVVGTDRVVRVVFPATSRHAVMQLCAALDLPVLDFILGDATGQFFLPLANVPDWDKAQAQLRDACGGENLGVAQGCGLVSVVGDGLGPRVGQFVSVLEDVGVEVRGVTGGPLRLSAAVTSGADGSKLALAQRALHQAFVA
jgi:aspartate kinase